MSKRTGGAVSKLSDKSKRMATNRALGTIRAVVTRTNSTFAEKAVAFEAHRRLIQDHYINLGPRVTYTKKSGDEVATTFRGDGLPEEVTRVAKTNAERAKEDKRASIKDEARADWKPKRYVNKWMAARGL
jgi:hypothetical protein